MSQSKLWLRNCFYSEIVNEAEKRKPLETGGAFMGYIAENKDVVVTDIIGAGENAEYNKHSFIPDQDYQLKEIERIYLKSSGMKSYLGDWHTHPNHTTDLSLKDKKTLTRVAITPESHNPNPIMVILGGQPREWTMNAVQFVSGHIYFLSFVKCKVKHLPHIFF